MRTVIDFRTPGEILFSGPDRLPYGVELAELPVSGGDLDSLYGLIASGDHDQQRRKLGDGRAASFMVEMNRGFVTDGRQREAFGAALRLMCGAEKLPLLYHCTGGKDRTGWMTAIVLTALGVPRELVLRDYLLSNDFHRTGYTKLRLDLVKTGIVRIPELLRPHPRAKRHLSGCGVRGGGPQVLLVENFLTRGLGASDALLAELRRALLGDLVPPEPVPLTPAAVSPCGGAGPGAASGTRRTG